MTQAERDRLVALKKAEKKLITQKQAAEELGITERHVRRLLRELSGAEIRSWRTGYGDCRRTGRSPRIPRRKRWPFWRNRCIEGSGPPWHRNTWRRNTLLR